mgnify:CR=1 FL=1
MIQTETYDPEMSYIDIQWQTEEREYEMIQAETYYPKMSYK